MAVLECSGLLKAYGDRTVVDGVSFRIEAGETYGLLGPNGAGKSTTINLVCGLLPRDGGEVRVDGRPFDDDRLGAKRLIGLVPQDIALYPDLTAAENLRFFGRLYGLAGRGLDVRVAATLETVGLTDRRDDRVETYSGGMKRRLNIGAGMLHRPRLLVLDEPTVGVDPQSRNAILESVTRLGAEGMAILYTTHYMEEAQRLCDRIGILDQGRMIAEGTHGALVKLVGEHERLRFGVAADADRFADAVRALPGVSGATVTDGTVDVIVEDAPDALARSMEVAARLDVRIQRVEVVEPDLEAVFLRLTGRALRDGAS
jgi:ABC-2 type transport system ATP-binding protein